MQWSVGEGGKGCSDFFPEESPTEPEVFFTIVELEVYFGATGFNCIKRVEVI